MLLSYSRSCEITPLSGAFVKSYYSFHFNFWKMLYIGCGCALRSFKVIQRHWNWYQSGKVRTHITITVHYCDSVSVFYCFRYITIFCRKFAFFCRFYPPQSHLKPSQEFSPLIYGMKVGIKNYSPWFARWWTPHEQFWRITTICWIDRQTADMPLVVM